MAKTYTVEKEINGKKYVAQFNGLSAALEAVDACHIGDSNLISAAKMTKYLLDNVVVDPKNLTADDFDTVEELNEVTDFARDVMQGLFRDKANAGAAEKKG